MKKTQGKGQKAKGKKKNCRKPRRGTVLADELWAIVNKKTGKITMAYHNQLEIYSSEGRAKAYCRSHEHAIPAKLVAR